MCCAVLCCAGNWANIVRYFPTTAFNFAFKDTYNKIFCPFDAKREPGKFFAGNLLSGGMAGASSAFTCVCLHSEDAHHLVPASTVTTREKSRGLLRNILYTIDIELVEENHQF